MNKYISGLILAGVVAVPGFVGAQGAPASMLVTPMQACFSGNMSVGSTGEMVRELQKFLNSDPTTVVALSGSGSSGSETTYFGPATRAAVIKFQNKYKAEVLTPAGLAVGNGFVGAFTRAKLNLIRKCDESNHSIPITKTPMLIVPNMTVVTPNGGEIFVRGNMKSISWSTGLPAGYTDFSGIKVDVSLVKYYPPCTTAPCPLSPVEAPYPIAKGLGAMQPLSWKVGDSLDPFRTITAGSYKIQVCSSGTTEGCDLSNAPFVIQ